MLKRSHPAKGMFFWQCSRRAMLSSEDVGQKWKLIANAQRVSSQPPVFIPIYYHNITHKTVSNSEMKQNYFSVMLDIPTGNLIQIIIPILLLVHLSRILVSMSNFTQISLDRLRKVIHKLRRSLDIRMYVVPEFSGFLWEVIVPSNDYGYN